MDSTKITSEAEELFARFLAEEGEGEAGFERLCARRPELARELRRLRRRLGTAREALGRLQRGAPAPDVELVASGPDDAADATPTLADLGALPPTAGRYHALGELARGGMGAVLQVRDRSLGRELAMKVVLRSGADGSPERAKLRARLLEEALVLGRLEHPGVVPVHDLGVDPAGRPYFTMPLVQGETFDAVVRRVHAGEDGWTLSRAVQVLVRVAETIGYAHHRGVVHRDLKPSNVMVGPFGETYVMDWGLAKVLGRAETRDVRLRDAVSGAGAGGAEGDSPLVTMDGDVVGTPVYMAPEQARGSAGVDGRADLYAIGAMLYHLLVGARPYCPRGSDPAPLEVLGRVLAGPPEPLQRRAPRAPAELVAICEKAMERDPARRYAHAGELAEDLRAHLEGRVVRAHRTGAAAELGKWVARNRLAAAGLAATLLAVGAGLLAVAVLRDRAADDLAESNRALVRRAYFNDIALAQAALEDDDLGLMHARLAACPPGLRGWEWRYLDRRSDGSAHRLTGHGARVAALAYAPDGARLATGGHDRTVRLWDAASGAQLAVRDGFDHFVAATAFLPGGDELAVTDLSGTVRLLDLGAGTATTLADEPGFASALAASPDGRRVAWSLDERVVLLDRSTGARHELARHDAEVHALAFTPDGGRLISAGWDGTLALWDPETATLERAIDAGAQLDAAAPSPDGRWLATGSRDRLARVWDLASGEAVAVLPEHPAFVYCVAWSPDGARLATAGGASVEVWEAGTWAHLGTLRGHEQQISELAFAPDGRGLATASKDGTACLWDLARLGYGRPQPVHADIVESVRFLRPDALLSAARDGRLVLRDLASGATLAERDLGVMLFALAVAPDGARFAAGDEDGGLWIGAGLERAPTRVAAHGGRVASAAFLPDGRRLASVSYDGTAALWDVGAAPPVLLWRSAAVPRGLVRLAVSDRGDALATGAWDGAIRIHDAETGAIRATLRGHDDGVVGLDLAPGGEVLASAGTDGTLRLWDVRAGVELHRTSAPGRNARPRFLAGGARLVTGGEDGMLTVWDAASLERIVVLGGAPAGSITALAAGPADGAAEGLVVSGALDGAVRLWDGRAQER